jgi:hypothetical protein
VHRGAREPRPTRHGAHCRACAKSCRRYKQGCTTVLSARAAYLVILRVGARVPRPLLVYSNPPRCQKAVPPDGWTSHSSSQQKIANTIGT